MTKRVDPEATVVQTNSKLIFEEAVKEFESKCQSLTNFCCESCQMTGINIKKSCINKQICTTCQASSKTKEKMEKIYHLV